MILRFLLCGCVGLIAAVGAVAQTTPDPPSPLVYHAGAPGRLTTDRDAQGGNPFASALVDVLGAAPLTLSDFSYRLAAGNARHSGGWHQTQLPKGFADAKQRLDAKSGQAVVALVLINADYSGSTAYSLPGAAFDARRVPEAFMKAGFKTTLVLDASVEQAREAMARFTRESESAEVAIVYVGGHGVQHKRMVYWMMGDYPDRDARWLASHAVSLDEIGASARARHVNLVLYASCRDDPFRE